MRFGSLLFLAILSLLTACGPAEAPRDSYTPPENPGGRMCTLQCGESQNFCNRSCDLTFRGCIRDLQSQAMQDYDKYTSQQFQAGQPIEFHERDFENTKACDTAHTECRDDCQTTYNVCYKNCGGQIGPLTSCQFLCF